MKHRKSKRRKASCPLGPGRAEGGTRSQRCLCARQRLSVGTGPGWGRQAGSRRETGDRALEPASPGPQPHPGNSGRSTENPLALLGFHHVAAHTTSPQPSAHSAQVLHV